MGDAAALGRLSRSVAVVAAIMILTARTVAGQSCEDAITSVQCAAADKAPDSMRCAWCWNRAARSSKCVACNNVASATAEEFMCQSYGPDYPCAANRGIGARGMDQGSGGAPPAPHDPSELTCAEQTTPSMCQNMDGRVARDGGTDGMRCAWCIHGRTSDRACVACSQVSQHESYGYGCSGWGSNFPCGLRDTSAVVERDPPKRHVPAYEQVSVVDRQQTLAPLPDDAFPNLGPGAVPNMQGPGQRPWKTEVASAVPPEQLDPSRYLGGVAPHPKWTCPVTTVFVRKEADPGLAELEPDELRSEQTFTDDVAEHLGEYTGLGEMTNTLFPHVSTKVALQFPEKIPFRDLTKHFFSCIDGRATYAVMGTPGGDIGEFLLAVNVLERSRPAHQSLLGFEDVLYYFQEYLEDMQEAGRFHFYMGTDSDAVQRWAKAALVANPLQPRGFEERDRLLAQSTVPEHVGNVALRAMLENPEDFKCRRELTEHVIRAFLSVYYDVAHPMRPKLLFVALNGTHSESALVYIDRTQGYPCGASAPLVVPKVRSRSFLVYHRAAADLYRAEYASWIAAKTNLAVSGRALRRPTAGAHANPPPAVQGQEMLLLSTMRDLARHQLGHVMRAFERRGAKNVEYRAYFSTEDDRFD